MSRAPKRGTARLESRMEGSNVGVVVAIHIASAAGTPMRALAEAEASAGEGLVGDRYRDGTGFYSATPTDPGARELTIISEEALVAVLAESGIPLSPDEHRRNVTSRGIALEPLLGKRFRIGEVVCEGVRLCPPCTHLEDVTGKAVMKPLVHRGGIRARIVEGGWIRVGDAVEAIA
jgi:MOSC domain-containing protein YiiM